jgi:Mce-associated membrane protein
MTGKQDVELSTIADDGEQAETPDTERSTAETASADASPATVAVPAWRSRLWPSLALLVVAALLIGVGVAYEIRQHTIRSQSSAKNSALADSPATSEVIGQVSTALNKVLSYQYANPTATQQAAGQLLTGDASTQYKTLFTALQQKAPGEKLTLVAKVVTAGVTSLHGNTAQLLVFLDQSSTRASDKQSSTSAAQLDVTAVKQGGTWKISELLPL